MSANTRSAARKFWEVVPRVMSSVAAQARRGTHRLTPTHFRILRMLSNRTCNLSQLAEQQDVSLPSMSASVQTLVARGWLERTRSSGDRRVTDLRVTPKGQRILAFEHARFVAWTAASFKKLSAEQIKQVEQGLDTLLHLFEDREVRPNIEQITQKV